MQHTRVLITSGGTNVPIDDVRFIGNMSTGRYGAEIADEFDSRNIDVLFWKSKNSVIPPKLQESCYNGRIDSGIYVYKDYYEYLNVVPFAQRSKPDIIISVAAVSDYIVEKVDGKISSDNDEITLKLKKSTKVLQELRKACPLSTVVGFKLLVDPDYKEVHNSVQKVLNGGADYVVYNDLSEIKKGITSRLVFDKQMKFSQVDSVSELVTFILEKRYDTTTTFP